METALGTPAQQEEMKQYIRDLQSFDWQFEYAESFETFKKGKIASRKLTEVQKRVDPTGAIWMQFKPETCSVFPSTEASN